jgi:hypothetical protein
LTSSYISNDDIFFQNMQHQKNQIKSNHNCNLPQVESVWLANGIVSWELAALCKLTHKNVKIPHKVVID